MNIFYDRRFFGDTISLVLIFLSYTRSGCGLRMLNFNKSGSAGLLFDRVCHQLSGLSNKVRKLWLINA